MISNYLFQGSDFGSTPDPIWYKNTFSFRPVCNTLRYKTNNLIISILYSSKINIIRDVDPIVGLNEYGRHSSCRFCCGRLSSFVCYLKVAHNKKRNKRSALYEVTGSRYFYTYIAGRRSQVSRWHWLMQYLCKSHFSAIRVHYLITHRLTFTQSNWTELCSHSKTIVWLLQTEALSLSEYNVL